MPPKENICGPHALIQKFVAMKSMILVFLFIMHFICLQGQVIENPVFSACSDPALEVHIDRIEITEISMTISLTVRMARGSEILITPDANVVSSEGGEKLVIRSANDITIGEPLTITRNRNQTFELVFPKPEEGVKLIDLHNGQAGNNWHFFEIDIDPGADEADFIQVPEKGDMLIDGVPWRYVNNPSFTAKSDETFRISRIELSENQTVLYFETTGIFGDWIIIPKESYIQPSDGGEKRYIESAEGTRINDEDYAGIMFIKLFFPGLNEDVQKINFKVLGYSGNWSVFELDVSKE